MKICLLKRNAMTENVYFMMILLESAETVLSSKPTKDTKVHNTQHVWNPLYGYLFPTIKDDFLVRATLLYKSFFCPCFVCVRVCV